MTLWIDTHCHLDAHEFGADQHLTHERTRAAGVGCCVIPAVNVGNYAAVRDLAHRFGDAYALGIHPMCTTGAGDVEIAATAKAIDAAMDDSRFIGVGEIGLDYFVPGLDDKAQTHIYREQLRIARDRKLPVIVHVRRSADPLLKHLREIGAGSHRWQGIAHAFNGSQQQAEKFIDMGFKLGFGGAATFDRALQIRRLAATIPLASMVMETDSPDIPPHWLYRIAEERAGGLPQARNEPSQLPRIGAEIAKLRGIDVAELAAATTQNALDAFPRLAVLIAPQTSPEPA